MAGKNCPSFAKFYDEVKSRGVRLTNQFRLRFMGSDFFDAFDGNIDLKNHFKEYLEGENHPVEFWASGAALPEQQLEHTGITYQGVTLSVPTLVKQTTTLSLTFKEDRSNNHRKIFEAWQDFHGTLDFDNVGVEGTIANGRLANSFANGGAKELPQCGVILDLMTPDHAEVVQSYVLVGTFPTQVGSYSLSQDSSEVASFSVNFQYQYWKRIDIKQRVDFEKSYTTS